MCSSPRSCIICHPEPQTPNPESRTPTPGSQPQRSDEGHFQEHGCAGAWRVSHRKETPHRQDRAAVSEPDAGGESRSAGESAERNEHAEADAAIRYCLC